jgi:hypothetical protein
VELRLFSKLSLEDTAVAQTFIIEAVHVAADAVIAL